MDCSTAGRRLRDGTAFAFRTFVLALAVWGGLDLARSAMAQDGETAYLPAVALAQEVEPLEARVAALEELLVHVSRDGHEIYVSGANVHIVNGEGATDTANGVGNVIIGYNEERPPTDTNDRGGSHMLVVGKENNYSGFGGIVVGTYNETTAPWSSVSGGQYNRASGVHSAVGGGTLNSASGRWGTVSGGRANQAVGVDASVSGGFRNVASGEGASVSGGAFNEASGRWGAASGGYDNDAGGRESSVSGGASNTASGWWSSVMGGTGNTASGTGASVSGGSGNEASAHSAGVSGGRSREAAAPYSWRAGGLFQPE